MLMHPLIINRQQFHYHYLDSMETTTKRRKILDELMSNIFNSLSNDVVHDFISFLDRRTLVKLSLVNKYFRGVIGDKFSTVPYMYLNDELRYCKDNPVSWTWLAPCKKEGDASHNKTYEPMPDTIIACIPTEELFRFRLVDFHFGTFGERPLCILRPVKHLWINCELRVKWRHESCFVPMQDFALLVRTCRKLKLYGQFGLTILPHLLKGNCTEIDISDWQYMPYMQMPLYGIENFLFSFGDDFRRLRFLTEFTGGDKIKEIVKCIKERFINSPSPAKFEFSWTQTHLNYPGTGIPSEECFIIENLRTKQTLQLLYVNMLNPETISRPDTIIVSCYDSLTPYVYENDQYWLSFSHPEQGTEFFT